MVGVARDLPRVLEVLDDGVLVVEDGRVIAASAALTRIAGAPREALIGREIRQLFTDSGGRPLSELADSDAARIRNAAGELIAVSLREAESGTYVVVDRSRERRLEQEVWRLTAELRRARAEGSSLPAPGSELASLVEHEVRTASTAVRGYLRMLLDEQAGPLQPQQSNFLREARRANDRVLALLRDLLELASPDAAAGLRIVRKPICLHEVIELATATSQPLLKEREIEISPSLDAEDDRVYADAGRLEQVFLNLFANAAKFAPAGSRVEVTSQLVELDAGPSVVITVGDSGPGIAEAEAERIFHPFVRGTAAAKGSCEGVGLGLAICRKLVEAHGGTIQAVPAVGCGLIRVMLPLDCWKERDG